MLYNKSKFRTRICMFHIKNQWYFSIIAYYIILCESKISRIFELMNHVLIFFSKISRSICQYIKSNEKKMSKSQKKIINTVKNLDIMFNISVMTQNQIKWFKIKSNIFAKHLTKILSSFHIKWMMIKQLIRNYCI